MTSVTRRRFLTLASAAAAGLGVASLAETQTDAGPTARRRTSFKPGELWLDTAGKPIQAHGGSIIQVDDRYYWYGENKELTTPQGDIWTWGVRCYGSADLYNWDDLGLIIAPDTENRDSPLHPAAGLDRPHIVYNATTRKFVCWFKLVKGKQQTLTVLVADHVTGPYQIVHGGVMPLGMGAGDFDLCVSPDEGKAYMYFERVHSELICADLTEDYTNFSGYYSTHFPHANPPLVREGPAYFRRRGKHYLATSGTTGYFPNPSQIAVADTFHGPYKVLGDLHPTDKSHTSFNSQISSVLKYPGKHDLYIAMADRWMGPQESREFVNGEKSRLIQSAFSKWFSLPHRPSTNGEVQRILTPPSPLTQQEIKVFEELRSVNTSQSRFVWLPIRFGGDRPVIEWRSEWKLDDFA